MARPTRKRKAISLETKYEIIQCVEMGNEPKKDVAARFDILSNTVSTILKNKEQIVESYEKLTIHSVLEVKSLSPSFVANSSDFANKIGPLIGIFWLRFSLNQSYKAASTFSCADNQKQFR
jgi:hypothetical protein